MYFVQDYRLGPACGRVVRPTGQLGGEGCRVEGSVYIPLPPPSLPPPAPCSQDNGREMWHSAPPPYSGESHSQASPPPMFVVPDSDDCTAGDGTMFVENNAYETHEFQPIPEPADNEPRFAITNSKRGEVREMVEFKSK